jgi:Holliday junction resolvase
MEYPEKITHEELVELGRDWLIGSYASAAPWGHYGCGVVVTEISAATWAGETPDVLGFCPHKSILIECKTSRADFNADKNKPFREEGYPEKGVGSQRWYMAPLGIIPIDKVPEKWGLLEVTPGRAVLVLKRPQIQERNIDSEMTILISAMRRLNVTSDGHIAIKRYQKLKGVPESKERASFFVNSVRDALMSDLPKVRALLHTTWKEYDNDGRSCGRSLACSALETAMEFLDYYIPRDYELQNRIDTNAMETVTELQNIISEYRQEETVRDMPQ